MNPKSYLGRMERFTQTPQWWDTMSTVVEAVVEEAKDGSHSVIPFRHLDVGCGTGKLCHWISERLHEEKIDNSRIMGIDVNKKAIRRAKQQNAREWCENSLFFTDYLPVSWPVFRGSLHSVTLCYVLGHCDDPSHVLEHIYRSLRRNGLLIIVSTNPLFDWAMWLHNVVTGYKTDPTLQHHWTLNDLCSFVSRFGFECVRRGRTGERFRYFPRCEALRAYNIAHFRKI